MTLEELAGCLRDEDARLRELVRLYAKEEAVQGIMLALAGYLVLHHSELRPGAALRGVIICVLNAILNRINLPQETDHDRSDG